MSEEDLKLYRGRLYKDWLVDRYALGLPDEVVMRQFEKTFDQKISLSDIREILSSCQEEIQKRERDLLNAYASSSTNDLKGMMYDLVVEIKGMLEKARHAQNVKEYTMLCVPLITALKEASKELERMQRVADASKDVSSGGEMLESIMFLQSEGVVEIKNDQALKRLLGVKVTEGEGEGTEYRE